MRWWPLRRPRLKDNGGAAAAARQDAEDQRVAAEARTPQVERTVRAAEAAVRRADRFAGEIENALRLKRGPV